jgi:hypothetical protein
MSFKDLLDKYNDGTASQEEMKIVEEELQKHEVISDYLSEGYDIGFEKEAMPEITKDETNLVKRSVNKKLRKVILASVGAVFLILLTINYIISPLISSFYYNPSQKTVAKYHEDLYFDLRVITELNLPGYALNTVHSENLGFGEYDVYFERINVFNRQSKATNTKIERGRKSGDSYHDFFPVSFMEFLDIASPNKNNNVIASRNEEMINYIKELNPVSYVSSYVILEQDISVKEFDELRKKYENKLTFSWAAVRTSPKGTPNEYLSGFNPNFNDSSVTEESADMDKYPYLQLVDYFRSKVDKGTFNGSMEEGYTKHFISLLKYVNDRKKAVAALDNNEIKSEYYKRALNYVESNGINIYGTLVHGEARELLQFLDNEKIKTIEIKGVLPSKYIN